MKMSKEKWILTAMLAAIVIVVTVFVILFYSSRPKIVLSDMISYYPDTVDITTPQQEEPVATINEFTVMEKLFIELAVGYWKPIKEAKANELALNALAVNYSMTIGNYDLDLLTSASDASYARVSTGKTDLYYLVSNEDYQRAVNFINEQANRTAK